MTSVANETQIEQAAARSDELINQIQVQDDLNIAYSALEQGISEYEKEYPIESLIPSDSELGHGVSLKELTKKGKDFWNIYSKVLRNKICDVNGKLHKLFKEGIGESSKAVISAIMLALALPTAALSVIAPISAIIIKIGIDHYCEWSAPSKS